MNTICSKRFAEQPSCIKKLLKKYTCVDHIDLGKIGIDKKTLKNFEKIYIVACGTAYHAGMIGKYLFEKYTDINAEVDVASEFRYRNPKINKKTLFIAISQSGETLDTLAALREAKKNGATVLSIVNVIGSSIDRESDYSFYTSTGPEISVASTKAYTAQLIALYVLSMYFASVKGTVDSTQCFEFFNELNKIPSQIEDILEQCSEIKKIATEIVGYEKVFFIGRHLDAFVAYEGSLKLKEISYINSFAIQAGELKHGTIALMDKNTIVISLSTQDFLLDKMLSNIQEIKARDAKTVLIEKTNKRDSNEQYSINIPSCIDDLTPLLSVVVLQLIAYYVAKEKGCNIDKPKNLAKSVTVE